MIETLAGWGNYPRADVETVRARGRAEALAAVDAHSSLIARGNGRAVIFSSATAR